MYLRFYGLNKEPFNITPDPAFLFLSPSHKEALAVVMYGVENRKGFVVITGEVGVGKTTILRSYLEQTANERIKTVYLFNTNVTFPALLKTICHELGLPQITDDPAEMLRQLHQFLIQEYRRGYNIVLVIDEAQNMPQETLENIRVLSNLETATDKLIQIIFSGQPEFDQLLDRHEMRQLKQRIAVRTSISSLTTKESAAYIKFRLAKAGNKDKVIFSPGALKRIVRYADGIPRVLNILCDSALITAFGYQKKQINGSIADEIIQDFFGKKKTLNKVWKISFATLLFTAFLIGLLRFSPISGLYRVEEKKLWNFLVHPIKNKIILPKSISEALSIPERDNSSDIQGVKAGDSPAMLVDEESPIIEKSPGNPQGQPIENITILPEIATEAPPPPESETFPTIREDKAINTQTNQVEDVKYMTEKVTENPLNLRPVSHKIVFGVIVDFVRWASLHNFPIIHDSDSIGHGHGLTLVMSHINDGDVECPSYLFDFQLHMFPQFLIKRP